MPRIRFLLADDPGAGKTIMAGLLLKELKIRGLVKRTLIITPASLSFQWQREMKEKFREQFEIIRADVLRTNYGMNPWQERNQVVTSISWVSRIDDAKESLLRSRWNLIIVDEPHKIGPNGLVEFATEREMAHLNHCLEREATTIQRKGVKKKASTARFVPLNRRPAQQRIMVNCPLCHCQVRENRLQKHMSLKCPSRPNYDPPQPARRRSNASASRKKSSISLRDIQLFVTCPKCGSKVASDQFTKHRDVAHGHRGKSLRNPQTRVPSNTGSSYRTSSGKDNKRTKVSPERV